MKHRCFLFLAGLGLFGLWRASQGWCDAAKPGDPAKTILFFSKSTVYEDPMIHRVEGRPGPAEGILAALGRDHHLHFIFTKDGSAFTPAKIAHYDAFCFFTSGDLTQPGYDHNPPMTQAGKAALLAAIREGKGFVGIHSAVDTFNSPPGTNDSYVEMLGGELKTRIRLEAANQRFVDRRFAGMSALPSGFPAVDEWYALKNFSPDLHVLLMLDTDSMVRGASYGPPFQATWIHNFGRGRVFYTSMGHEAAVWHDPAFQALLAGGLSWAVGNADADARPNLAKVAPVTSQNAGVFMRQPASPLPGP